MTRASSFRCCLHRARWLAIAAALAVFAPLACHDAQQVAGTVDATTYTCPMHPQVRQDHAGQCPICHMDLVPVAAAPTSGDVVVHEVQRSNFGIDTARVVRGPLLVSVRAPGRVGFDETRVFDVTLRVSGYIARLFLDAEGTAVEKGQPIAWLESPEILSAQLELLRVSSAAAPDATLLSAARKRLLVWGMSDGQIDEVVARKEALDPVPLLASQSGVVVEKDVVAGQRVEAGTRLVRLARLDKVWIEAEVYPDEAARLKPGAKARIRLLGTDTPLEGKLSRILPRADTDARTVKVRIDVENTARALVAGAAVIAEISVERPDALLIPLDAVIPTGTRHVVFVASEGSDALALREVEVGERGVDTVEVKSGLAEGERVVHRGAFLIASESRLRVPLQWEEPR